MLLLELDVDYFVIENRKMCHVEYQPHCDIDFAQNVSMQPKCGEGTKIVVE